MKTIRTAVAAAGLVAALAGCGTPVAGTPAPQPAPPPSLAAPPDPATDQRAIETLFQDYYGALRAHDFSAACGFNAPETTDQMLANLRSRGVEAATCEDAMTAIYAIPENARIADQVAENANIENVVINGDEATVTWSSEIDGNRSPGTTRLRRVDGRWLLASAGT